MLSVKFTWVEAAIATGLVLAVAVAAALARRRSDSSRPAVIAVFAREAGMLLGLFALWTYAGSKSEVSLAEAMHRAAWIWHVERDVGLPSEQALQQVFLPHPLLVQALNWYYAVLHFPVLIGCLVWLFVWHRGEYWRVRTLVLVFTAVSLLVQFIPVAPPRLLPLTGMTDTGLTYGQSVYGAHGGIDADQLSAMPSIHIGWALLVALVVVATARTRWRWLALAYPVLTTLAVVVTANHFWLDGIAAAVVLALAIWAQRAAGPVYRALAGAIRRSRPATAAAAVAGVPDAAGGPDAAMADAPEMVPVGAMTAHAVGERRVTAAASAGEAQERGQYPDEAQAAPAAHARASNGSHPCGARAVRARVTSRNQPGRRPPAGHATPSRDQDGR
jgi:PAP2 superfamily